MKVYMAAVEKILYMNGNKIALEFVIFLYEIFDNGVKLYPRSYLPHYVL